MWTILLLLFVVVCQLTLAAHALRGGDLWLFSALVVLVVVQATRWGFVRLVWAFGLILGALFWVRTGLGFMEVRAALGEPWLRLACILAALVLGSLGAGLLLLGERARGFFRHGTEHEGVRAAAFVLAVFGLWLARGKAKVAVLLADRFWPGAGWVEMVLLGLYAAWLAGVILDPARHKRLRPRLWALFSAVFFGQLLLGLVGFPDFLMTGRLHLPIPALIAAGPLFRGGGLFMPILFVSTVVLVGPAWCSHLCYIGAWDDQCSRLGPKRTRPLSRRWAIGGRLVALILTCGAALLLHSLAVPAATAAVLAAGFGIAGLGVMLFVSRYLGVMAHCTAFCPIGLLGNILGRLTPWRVAITLSTCTQCGTCARVCRYSALTPAEIEVGAPGLPCTLCGDCIGACPHDSMAYRLIGPFRNVSPGSARAVLAVLLAVLMALFLGVARI
jgi:ferredoxin